MVAFNIYAMIFLKWVRFALVVSFFSASILIGAIGMHVTIGEGLVQGGWGAWILERRFAYSHYGKSFLGMPENFAYCNTE